MNSNVERKGKIEGASNTNAWLMIALYVLLSLFVSIIISSISQSDIASAINLFLGNFTVLIVFLIAFPDIRENIADTFKISDKELLKKYLIYTLIAIVGYYILNTIIGFSMAGIYSATSGESIWNYWTDLSSVNQEAVEKSVNAIPWLGFFSVVIVAPIVEEMVFRKAIFDLNSNKLVAIAISSFVFGLIHILSSIGEPQNMWFTLTYILIGAVLSTLYYKTDEQLVYSTGVHMTINLVAYIVLIAS